MEIPEIGIFEAGMKCLQSPSYASRVFPFPIENSPQVYSFWKWGAVIVAFLATFTRLLKQIKYLIIHIRRIKPSPESLLQHLDVDLDLSDDDGDYEASNGSSADEGDEPETPSADDYMNFFTDFDVKGSNNYFSLRFQPGQCENTDDDFNWADFTTGKNVVKIWDRLGSSLGFDCFDDDSSDSENVVSLWDFNKGQKISDILRRSPQLSSTAVISPSTSVTSPSPSVVLSAKLDEKDDGLVLEAYDTRAKTQNPVSYAEWRRPLGLSRMKEVTVTSGGVEKFYVGDVAAGDMRKLKTPLENVTESEDWDVDGVTAQK